MQNSSVMCLYSDIGISSIVSDAEASPDPFLDSFWLTISLVVFLLVIPALTVTVLKLKNRKLREIKMRCLMKSFSLPM